MKEPTATRVNERGIFASRTSICPLNEDGGPCFELDPGDCMWCGRPFRCGLCGTAEHPFISCQAAREIDERCKK